MTVSFAERLRQFRTEKGISQQQLAMKMLVDRSSIARWENGSRSPDILLMFRLAECLGVEVSDLLNEESAEHAITQVIIVDDEKPNLAVEQARFEDKLSVVFDTPHTDFRLPPLTLQPIVENAVKHGMDPEIERMNVIIRTRRVDGGSEIIVEDDGADFLPAGDIEEGVGLSSTRLRLERMCGGTLSIAPRAGGGAVATLRIPETAK